MITLREGIAGTNLIRRFRGDVEITPVYVKPRDLFEAEGLREAKQQAVRHGHRGFVYRGTAFFIANDGEFYVAAHRAAV